MNKQVEQIIEEIIRNASSVNIDSNVPFSWQQKDELKKLHQYCVSQVLRDFEVAHDPRKLNYMASQEFKIALVAICLSQAVINPARRQRETKEFFIENINVYRKDQETKMVEFNNLGVEDILASINSEIIGDWQIYRDREGMGIAALIDEKTNLTGLAGFARGGDPIYEFARFHRKYTEAEHKKENQRRERAQETLQNAMIQAIAQDYAKNKLLEGKNPMEILDAILNGTSKARYSKIQERKELSPEIENQVNKLLEYDDKSYIRSR